MALFEYYELFETDIVSWEIYNFRIHAANKLVEGSETLLNFLENTIFVSTDMDQEAEFYTELDEIVSQLAQPKTVSKIFVISAPQSDT